MSALKITEVCRGMKFFVDKNLNIINDDIWSFSFIDILNFFHKQGLDILYDSRRYFDKMKRTHGKITPVGRKVLTFKRGKISYSTITQSQSMLKSNGKPTKNSRQNNIRSQL